MIGDAKAPGHCLPRLWNSCRGQEYQSGYGQFPSDVARSDKFHDGGRQQQKSGNEPKYDGRFGVSILTTSRRSIASPFDVTRVVAVTILADDASTFILNDELGNRGASCGRKRQARSCTALGHASDAPTARTACQRSWPTDAGLTCRSPNLE